MRRLLVVMLIALLGGMPALAQAQTQPVTPQAKPVLPQSKPAVPPPAANGSSDYGLHPALAVVAGGVTGVVLAAAIGASMVVGQMLVEGVALSDALELGTGLRLSAVAASGVLGALAGYFLFEL